MRALLGLLFFLSQPFWDAKPPENWTDYEVDSILHASPWAQMVGPSPEILVYLATAAPVEEAQKELRLRGKHPAPQPDPDYTSFEREHRAEDLVLAIPYPPGAPFGTQEDRRRMEDECAMAIGKRTYKIVGHFPPVAEDPVLRLVFPRELKPADKLVTFRLFLPAISFPERELQFWVKDLIYRGEPEM